MIAGITCGYQAAAPGTEETPGIIHMACLIYTLHQIHIIEHAAKYAFRPNKLSTNHTCCWFFFNLLLNKIWFHASFLPPPPSQDVCQLHRTYVRDVLDCNRWSERALCLLIYGQTAAAAVRTYVQSVEPATKNEAIWASSTTWNLALTPPTFDNLKTCSRARP